jgi:hypothetical protein
LNGCERQILLWLHVANGRGYYSGSMETKLTQDLSVIRQSGEPQKLLGSLRTVVGRTEFESDDLALPLLGATPGECGLESQDQVLNLTDGVPDHVLRTVQVQDEAAPQAVR